MKKVILFFLFTAGTVNAVHAQGITYDHEPGASEADVLFNSPKPGKAKVNFHFWGIGKKYVQFTLELYSIKQLYRLPNLDSVVTAATDQLKLLADSLKEDGIIRRLDIGNAGSKSSRIRLTSYNTSSQTFTVKSGELNVLKIGRDTLRIQIPVATGEKTYVYGRDGKSKQKVGDEYRPVFLTFTLNNITDIETIVEGTMNKCLEALKKDMTVPYVSQNSAKDSYRIYYSWDSGKLTNTSNRKWIKQTDNTREFVPNIYASLQFARGSFVPSASAGFRYTTKNEYDENIFYLMFDWYMFFSRDSSNKLRTDANNFITFQFTQLPKNRKGNFDFVANYSLGYLIRRKGDWFNKSTFKFGLPGVRSGWLQIEPECYFQNFFRNFSPGIKLTINYE